MGTINLFLFLFGRHHSFDNRRNLGAQLRGVYFDIIYFLRTTFCRNFQTDISMFKFCEFLQFFQNFAASLKNVLKPAIFSFCEFQNFIFFQSKRRLFEIRKIWILRFSIFHFFSKRTIPADNEAMIYFFTDNKFSYFSTEYN